MIIKNLQNGQILNDIKLTPTNKVYSSSANESEVETIFENYLKDIGFGLVGELYTKRTAKSKLDTFPSKTGSGTGYPDYVFYDNDRSEKIIAVGDAKKPDPTGKDNSLMGLSDCTDIYLRDYNKKHKDKIKIAFGYDGINFVIKYFDEKEDKWVDITIDGEPLTTFPEIEFLKSISKYGNIFSTQVQKNISKELLEPYFAQCDAVFRMAKNSLSAIDKAAEISIFIFLKIFSNDRLDEEFKKGFGYSVWELIEEGKVSVVNKLFKDFLNKQYENVFPEELIKVNEQSSKDLAKIINTMFFRCNIDRMTDVKGNALEYYQKDSKDRKIGEFFTPRHLIDLMVSLTNPQITFRKNDDGEYILDDKGNHVIEHIEKIYDPACGSGGFLIQAFLTYIEKYSKYGISNKNLKKNVIFGNELKDSTVMLTKLNMILLGDGHNHISNENALSYKKKNRLEKIKDENNKPIIVEEKDVDYKEEYIGTEKVINPYHKITGEPIIEQTPNVKYYIANRSESGNLSKKKDADGNYTEVPSEDVDIITNEEGNKEYYIKGSHVQLLKVGKSDRVFYKAKVKMQNDGVTPIVDFIDVKAVNDKVKEYHKKFFGNFDIVMANHPYALEAPNKPDELFIKHMIEAVRKSGRIACVVGETLLFHNTYASFREWALNNITVEAIISLPQGVFNPYTDVKTSILILKKERAPKNHKSWLVDLQNDGFDLNLTRAPIDGSEIPRVKRLWEKWGGYIIQNEKGEDEYKSFHKEEMGFAEFHSLDKKNWCVKRYNTPFMSLNSQFELKPINEILKRKKEVVEIQDNVEYKQVTIQVKNRGIILRETQYGVEIGTKRQFHIKKGQFLISKIDARNGAYGIVPDDLDNAIITGNFWVYKINTDIVYPEFLTYLMRHDFFNKMCNVCSYGSTNRWYLDEDTFDNFKIPVPSLPEQKVILDKIKEHNDEILKAQSLIDAENKKIMGVINEVVG